MSQEYVANARQRIADTLAGMRQGTDIAENPELLRPQRKVGHAAAGRKPSRHAAPPGVPAARLFD